MPHVVVDLTSPRLRHSYRPVRPEYDVVAENVLAAGEPHVGMKRVIDHDVVLYRAVKAFSQLDSSVQSHVVVDAVIRGAVIQVDVPSVVASPAVVAQRHRLHGVQARELAVRT